MKKIKMFNTDANMTNMFDWEKFIDMLSKGVFNEIGGTAISVMLREPVLDGSNREVTEADIKKYEKDRKEYFDKLRNKMIADNKDVDMGLPTGEGLAGGYFVFPYYIYGIYWSHDERVKDRQENGEFKIYLGLHPSKIVKFMEMFDEIACKKEKLRYSYKFYSPTCADRAVIYPYSKDLPRICEIIEEIEKRYPDLFEDAVDKHFTSRRCRGVGLACDTTSSFTENLSKVIDKYLWEQFEKYIEKVGENTIRTNLYFVANGLKNESKYPRLNSLNMTSIELKKEFVEKYLQQAKLRRALISFNDKTRRRVDLFANPLSFHMMAINFSDKNKYLKEISNYSNFKEFLDKEENRILSSGDSLRQDNLAFTEKAYNGLKTVFDEYNNRVVERQNQISL